MTTNTILMVPPNKYAGWNPETAKDNTFMISKNISQDIIFKEYYNAVSTLKNAGINVILAKRDDNIITPDCLFPNNWISFHNGNAIIYPMRYKSRQLEIRNDILMTLTKNNYIKNTINLTNHIKNNYYLEGTGALVLDRVNKIAYGAVSERCNPILASKWCLLNDYKLILFETKTPSNDTIYHTNVICSVGSTYVVLCMELIKSNEMKNYIKNVIKYCNKELIDITYSQVKNFCGNILELRNNNNDKILVMSTKAYKNFTNNQLNNFILKHNLKIIHSNINNIEECFGGGYRCMIAEVFKYNNNQKLFSLL